MPGFEQFIEEIKNQPIDDGSLTISLSNPSFNMVGRFSEFCQVLGQRQNLKELKLTGCKLGNKEIALLVQTLKNLPQLKIVCLAANNFGQENEELPRCEAALTELMNLPNLTGLTLNGNGLTKRAAQILADSLKKNKNLKHLNLAGCGLNSETLQIILQSLAQNETLTHFSVANNNVSTNNLDFLLSMLDKNRTLIKLNLLGCSLNSAGLVKIAAMLKKNKNLQGIDLSNNAFDEPSTRALIAALKENQSLQGLHFDNQVVNDNIAALFLDVLEKNYNLIELGLPDLIIGGFITKNIKSHLKRNALILKMANLHKEVVKISINPAFVSENEFREEYKNFKELQLELEEVLKEVFPKELTFDLNVRNKFFELSALFHMRCIRVHNGFSVFHRVDEYITSAEKCLAQIHPRSLEFKNTAKVIAEYFAGKALELYSSKDKTDSDNAKAYAKTALNYFAGFSKLSETHKANDDDDDSNDNFDNELSMLRSSLVDIISEKKKDLVASETKEELKDKLDSIFLKQIANERKLPNPAQACYKKDIEDFEDRIDSSMNLVSLFSLNLLLEDERQKLSEQIKNSPVTLKKRVKEKFKKFSFFTRQPTAKEFLAAIEALQFAFQNKTSLDEDKIKQLDEYIQVLNVGTFPRKVQEIFGAKLERFVQIFVKDIALFSLKDVFVSTTSTKS